VTNKTNIYKKEKLGVRQEIKMNNSDHREIKRQLSKNPSCYVLITCYEMPAKDGKMQVEMSYNGDVVLASYLLQGAQNVMDECAEETIYTERKER
jgi:hypothetical protein